MLDSTVSLDGINPSNPHLDTTTPPSVLPSDPPRLQDALRYLARGWCPVPLCPPDHCGPLPPAHIKTCERPGKRPPWSWKHLMKKLPAEEQVRSWWAKNPDLNVGVVMGDVSHLVGIDVDDAGGGEALVRLSRGDLPETLRFDTPGGGYRLLFRLPPGMSLRTTSHPGTKKPLHILSEGSLTVMPPSRHHSGGEYRWAKGCDLATGKLAHVPHWLLPQLMPNVPRVRKAQKQADQGGGLEGGNSSRVRKAVAWTAKADPAISGAGGHNATFRVACKLIHYFGLSEVDALRVLVENYNPRCDPPWLLSELAHKVADALGKGHAPRGPELLPRPEASGGLRDNGSGPEASGVSAALSQPAAIADTKSRMSADHHHTDSNGIKTQDNLNIQKKSANSHQPFPGVKLSEFVVRDVSWLLDGLIPFNELTLLEGKPKIGKSMVISAIVAAVTSGKALPGTRARAPANVLWFSSEEDPHIAIRPRLEAHGADVDRVRIMGRNPASPVMKVMRLPNDIPAIEAAAKADGANLVVIDPIRSFKGGSIDSNREDDVGAMLEPLAWMARATGAAVVGIRHFGKRRDGAALDQGLGSTAYTAVARSVLQVRHVQGSKTKRTLGRAGGNHGPDPKTREFEIVTVGKSARVEWGKAIEASAEELAEDQGDAGERDAIHRAEKLLRASLKDGWRPCKDIKREAEDAMIGLRTLDKAKAKLGVRSRRRQIGDKAHWEWGPPEGGFPKGEGKDAT